MNTVSVSFSGYRHSAEASAALWQWDYGQRLIIRGLNLPDVYEVHFCNPGDAESITTIGDSTGVSIPDELLETGKYIKAYIYLHEGTDDGETEYEITIKVYPRARPSDRGPRESERSVLDEVLVLLNSLTGGQNQGSSLNGVLNYTALINRPRINGKTLAGDMAGEELGLVNAEDGKGLSSNDYTQTEKAIVNLLLNLLKAANNGKVLGIINGTLAATEAHGTINGHNLGGEHAGVELGLVDAEDGKGLSSNDYTNEAKQIVDLLAALSHAENDGKLLTINRGSISVEAPQNFEQFATKEELTDALSSVQANLTFDNQPVIDSQNPVTSGCVYRAIKEVSDQVSAIQTALNAFMKDSGNAPKVFVDDQDILVIVGDTDVDDDGYLCLPWATVENDIVSL